MSDEKKPFEREDDEVLAIIEEYRKKYASEDVQDEKATPADEKPPEPKAESPIMAHFHDTAELRASSAQSTLNIEAHLTSLNGQIPPADPVEGSGVSISKFVRSAIRCASINLSSPLKNCTRSFISSSILSQAALIFSCDTT